MLPRVNRYVATLVGLCVFVPVANPALGFQLITAEDVSYRDGPSIKPRGNVPGPVVTIEKPGGLAKLSSPISFAVKFAAFAGAKVDVSSTRIIYLKDPWIDLTQRVIDNVGANVFTTTGFSFSDAEVVEGTHTIRIEVRDTDGRVGFSTITFAVR
jgi:hypothetical protein